MVQRCLLSRVRSDQPDPGRADRRRTARIEGVGGLPGPPLSTSRRPSSLDTILHSAIDLESVLTIFLLVGYSQNRCSAIALQSLCNRSAIAEPIRPRLAECRTVAERMQSDLVGSNLLQLAELAVN